MKREYPRQAWILMPSFKTVEITITKPAHTYGTMFEDWDWASNGKSYHIKNLYRSKEAAIEAGRQRIEELRADIAKRQATLDKRIAALDKAEAKA